MKMNNFLKLGLMMLVLLAATGAAAASGGSSYSTATSISVPNGDIDIWSGTCKSTGDWYKFTVISGDSCYIDLQKTFYNAGGSMYLYKTSTNIDAQVAHPTIDHYAYQLTSVPRIKITKGTQSSYQFIAGRNYVY
ncbi:hypothetical protein [uncultured Methanomethylovorans sp.]|uniref:hypothetical protein n=1 Tax=uncultured Methanomethylovorans sp. TaxID=183759 RepID=UPI002AA63212|nr:hypothetical protein [uncultured Methanomethylovorans sp.]